MFFESFAWLLKIIYKYFKIIYTDLLDFESIYQKHKDAEEAILAWKPEWPLTKNGFKTKHQVNLEPN